ncbi:MAG TPA: response regulator transcription factor [Halanaerobiaceae bacterium]|nr:response regulator transcription factor [Bacillota bacterium]HHU92569.1 response regulator transcription factor [Halanaerobiaceae bacterium]HOA41392.1 response regulator transcription factor [Halanaerobiales bacterium]HPZ62898.1 response regulator transcription factor [Halanaerobiales bacterium]HQD04103.1 response regulator transcription factor [Halanaerobiales bacterium]
MSSRILIVEDEVQLARLMELELDHEGYAVKVSHNGREALELLKEEEFDLVLLDIMLPEMDGIEVCGRLRKFSDIPVIMVTAKDAVPEKVEALDTGADDYITKPFAIEELLARIRALLRRKEREKREDNNVLLIADLEIDTDKYKVKRADQEVELTKKEFDLLVYLVENQGIVLSREDILSNIWGYDYLGETNIVDVYIRYLRSKIDDPFEQKLIKTVRGVGYVIRDDQE